MSGEAEESKKDRVLKAIDDLRPNVMGYVMGLPEHYLLWEQLRKAVLKELNR